jgi:cytochrome c oxidase subunit 2
MFVATGAALTVRHGSAETSVLDPAGPRAARIAELWWVLFGVGTSVFLAVMAVLLFALWRARRDAPDPHDLENGTRPILAGVVLSSVLMVGVVAFTLWTQRSLAQPTQDAALTIEVEGKQWWWEIRYPDDDVVTANELHIPTGTPVAVRLTTDNVIHSFWVPQLTDKMDLVPGRVNELWFQADEPGTYRGFCAEFCGIQHTFMQFIVVAEPRDAFATWLEDQAAPATEPTDELLQEGQRVFFSSACMACHTVRGTDASGVVGPDLTHLASRQLLAAGARDNTADNLAAWIADPQAIKPGNFMPTIALDADALRALVAYLMSLT